MTAFLLDTNIISNLIQPEPSASLVDWMAAREDAKLHIASLTLAEITKGIEVLPAGRKRNQLQSWFDGPDGPPALFAGRILPFDAAAALIWGRLMAEGVRSGQPRSGFDTIIAAVALANECILVTDNERHFRDVPLVNPLRGGKA